MSKIPTILNRIVWMIALISTVAMVVIVRSHARSSAEISSLREAVASGQKSIDAATKRQTERDSALQQKLKEIETLRRKVQTPAQVVAALPAAFPQLPLPITVSRSVVLSEGQDTGTNQFAPMSTTDSSNSARIDLGSETSGAVVDIPDADLKPLYDMLQDCRTATATTETLEQDLADTKTLLSQRKTSSNTRWSGVKRAAKWLAVGAALEILLSRER